MNERIKWIDRVLCEVFLVTLLECDSNVFTQLLFHW